MISSPCTRPTVGAVRAARGDLAARSGGEEFVVLLSNADTARRPWRSGYARGGGIGGGPCRQSRHVIEVAATGTVAIGDLLVQQADAALYQTEREGRNRVVVAATARGKTVDRGDARA